MNKFIILSITTFFVFAGPWKTLLSDRGLLSIKANGEFKKGKEFATVWNYDSSEDRSFEHFYKNEKSKNEVDKIDVFLEKDGEKIKSYFEFSQTKSFVNSDMNYWLSAFTYENGIANTWVICRKKDECTVISQSFCNDALKIDKESESSSEEFANILSKHSDELFRIKKNALGFGKKYIEGISDFLRVPYQKFFVDENKKLVKDILKNRVDPFDLFGPGDSVLYECKLLQDIRPKEEKDSGNQINPSIEKRKSSSKIK